MSDPKLGLINRAVVWGALCLLTTTAMAGSALAQDRRFTQCFREKAMLPCDQWKSNQDFCHSIKHKLYLDESRGCYGQRWSIPEDFYRTKYVAYKPITETVILVLGRPGVVDGATDVLPGRSLSKVPTLYKEVMVRALMVSTFNRRRQQALASYEKTSGLADTNEKVHGFRVFDQTKSAPGQYREVFLLPAEEFQWYARCLVKPGVRWDEGLKSPGGCFVLHGIDDRLYVQFFVKNSELADVQAISTQVVNKIRSFMVT